MSLRMQIEYWPLERLHLYEKNPRKNDHAVPKMVQAITEFGFRVPILAKSDGEIVDGHLRFKAAVAMELEEVPVILADDMSDAQITAFRLSVNKVAEFAEWDDLQVKADLEALAELDFDVELTGFDDADLARLTEVYNALNPEDDPNMEGEWDGMPEFEQPDATAYRSLIVHFASEEDAQGFAKLIGQNLTEKTKFIWFPKAERDEVADIAIAGGEDKAGVSGKDGDE